MIYDSLASVDFSITSPPILSLMELTGEDQSIFNRVTLARLHLVSLFFLSIGEMGLHAATASLKFTAFLIQLLCFRIFKGVAPQRAITETGLHIKRVVRLAIAAPCALALGLASPKISLRIYHHLSLIKQKTEIDSALLLKNRQRLRSAANVIAIFALLTALNCIPRLENQRGFFAIVVLATFAIANCRNQQQSKMEPSREFIAALQRNLKQDGIVGFDSMPS